MEKTPILLLQPTGNHSSLADQFFGARLAASWGAACERIVLEQDSFRHGDLNDLERSLCRWSSKVSGVVGVTSVPESNRLGELTEELNLLCFVSNNNPAVWQHRSSIFHIGVPTAMTSAAVAERLLKDLDAKRFYLLYDNTEFQRHVASSTEMFLKSQGAEVRPRPGDQDDWLDDVRWWKPDLLYLVHSNEDQALPLVKSLRRVLPNMFLLMGRSLLRHSFLSSLGEQAEGLLLVDLYHRGAPQREQERILMRALDQAEVKIPTANHGFGWDAMTLCGLALADRKGDPSSASKYLESGVYLEGATGCYRFSPEDHNGRATFNPTILSRLRNSKVEMFSGSRCG